MLRTITVGTHVSVQGIFVRETQDGRIVVRVGDEVFKGTPIREAKAA